MKQTTVAFLLVGTVAAFGFGGCGSNPTTPSPVDPGDSSIPQRILFAMNYSSAAYPDAGWRAYPVTAAWTRSHVPGGGPRGEDAIEMSQFSVTAPIFFGGQFDWGWREFIEARDPAPGQKRYYRWRMMFSLDSNFKGLAWDDGHPSSITNKVLILGQNCGARCRVVVTYDANPDNLSIDFFRVQIGGGEDLIQTGSYPRGVWLDIQVELTPSSTSTAEDGGYKIWVNNDSYQSPTAERSGILLRPVAWQDVWFGAFNNDGLQSDGVHRWRHTGFQVAETFDNRWRRR